MVSCCKLLGIRSFVPEVRSWSGNNVPVNLYQTNVIQCPVKGKVPRHKLHPPRSWSWLRGGRSQLAAPSRPGPQTLPSCHVCHAPNPLCPQSPQVAQKEGRPGLTDCNQGRWLCYLVAETGMGRGEVHCSSRSGPRLVEGLSEGSGTLQDIVPSVPWVLQFTHWPKAGWAGGPPGEGLNLLFHLMTTTPLTLGWITSPFVPHWQLLVGRAHGGTDQ